LNNYPINLFEDDLENTIGVRICTDYETNYSCPEEYVMALINLFTSHLFSKELMYPNNTIYIKDACGLSVMSFDLDLEMKKKIYQCGINAVNEFITKN